MFSAVGRWATNLRIAYERERAIAAFSKLSDLQLRDIGVERNAIEEHVRGAMPWRGRNAHAAQPARASLQGCG